MTHKLLSSTNDLRLFTLIFQTGDDPIEILHHFAEQQKLHAAHFSAIGAFSDAVLGWFNWESKQYKHIPIHDQVEVLSLLGDVTLEKNARKIHAHVILGTSEAHARGGHLLTAHVRPTLELFLEETHSDLRRTFDPTAQIALIQP